MPNSFYLVVMLLATSCVSLLACECEENGEINWTCCCQKHIRMFGGNVNCDIFNGSTLSAYVSFSYCVTHSDQSNTSMVIGGMCPIYGNQFSKPLTNDLNMCEETNRAGVLCGKCSPGYSLVVNSFQYSCVNTTQHCHDINWLVYFVEQFLPLTVVYLIVVLCNIRAMDERANAFILYAQVVSLNFNLDDLHRSWVLMLPHEYRNSSLPIGLTKAIGYIYGVWNLDVAQGLFTGDLCLSGNITILTAFCLQYVTALFPLVLMLITYVLIELHARDFRILVKLWRPIHNVIARFRRKLDRKTSIIDAFATFLLLSYTKFTIISFNLLATTKTVTINGTRLSTVLFYNGEEYFTNNHAPYFAMAIFVLLFVVLPPPILLFVYPTKKFQRFLDRFNLRSQFLTTFTDAFQGCYKDSSNGGRDCRFFAGLYFAVRIVVFITYCMFRNYFTIYSILQFNILTMIALFAIFRPYKKDIFNKLDILIFLFFAFVITTIILGRSYIDHREPNIGIQSFFYITLWVPALTLLCFKIFQFSVRLCKKRRGGYTFYRDSSHFGPNSSIQDRQVNLITKPITSSSVSLSSDSESDYQD